MDVRWVEPDVNIGAHRGEAVICVPVYGAHERFVSCLHSVLTHTPVDAPILVCDDASPDSRSQEFVRELERDGTSEHRLFYLRRERNVGFPVNMNGAFAMSAPADVVILNSDCVVADGWLDGLRAAAYVDSRVATASALTNHGSVVSVPERRPMPRIPQDWSLDDAAGAIRRRSLRIRPRLPTAIGHCVYIRRSALELVGDFDSAFTPGYGEEVDFSQRCRANGLCHVVADDVFVLHHGGGSFTEDGKPTPVQEEHERVLAVRYPYYHAEVRLLEQDVTGPLARARGAARRALKGLSVIIDARILSGAMTGTQRQVLEVVASLARSGSVRITALVPDELGDEAAQTLGKFSDVRLLTRTEASGLGRDRADVVHRPYQIVDEDDLSLLARLGERLIVTNQDLISFHNPYYFRSPRAWQGYRRITRTALGVADRVIFLSEHARADALSEDLVDPGRASVVHNGVDHSVSDSTVEAIQPRGAGRLPEGAEAILCLGTDFRHKNRLFALRVLEQLQRRHEWPGYLVLAGPRVDHGSSTPEEAQLLARNPRLAQAVLDLAAVSEAGKAWLFQRAGLVLYPTVHEGFGLVPFEAASHGLPCMWAPGTSLNDVLPDEAAEIVAWNAEHSADRALELLRDRVARDRNVAAIRSAGTGLTWDATASCLIEIYQETCDRPATAVSAFQRQHGLMNGSLSEDAMRLLGPRGALSEEFERPLLALATHPQLGKPVFGAIRAGYRASHRIRRLRKGNGGGRPA